MKELLEYRVFLVNRLGRAAEEFCEAGKVVDLNKKISGEWTVHQVAFHLRDLNNLVYDVRVRQTLNEENPLFENFDPEEWMTTHYDKNESLEKVLSEFKLKVDSLCTTLSEMPNEAWSRLSQHKILGSELTLQLWVEYGLAHIEEHLLEIKKHL